MNKLFALEQDMNVFEQQLRNLRRMGREHTLVYSTIADHLEVLRAEYRAELRDAYYDELRDMDIARFETVAHEG